MPRRTAVPRVLRRQHQDCAVLHEEPTRASYQGERPQAEPEFPWDLETGRRGWTRVDGTYRRASGRHPRGGAS